jgi:hypothetical protein
MSVKGILKGLASALLRVVDSDHDGKLELSDLPGALAGLASMQALGEALIEAARVRVDGFKALASQGQITANGQVVTADQVDAAWEAAKAKFTQAADEARAALGR